MNVSSNSRKKQPFMDITSPFSFSPKTIFTAKESTQQQQMKWQQITSYSRI